MSTQPAPHLVLATTRNTKTSRTIAPAPVDRDGPAMAYAPKGGRA